MVYSIKLSEDCMAPNYMAPIIDCIRLNKSGLRWVWGRPMNFSCGISSGSDYSHWNNKKLLLHFIASWRKCNDIAGVHWVLLLFTSTMTHIILWRYFGLKIQNLNINLKKNIFNSGSFVEVYFANISSMIII